MDIKLTFLQISAVTNSKLTNNLSLMSINGHFCDKWCYVKQIKLSRVKHKLSNSTILVHDFIYEFVSTLDRFTNGHTFEQIVHVST